MNSSKSLRNRNTREKKYSGHGTGKSVEVT